MFRLLDGWNRVFLEAMNAYMDLRTGLLTSLQGLGLRVSDDLRQSGTLRPGAAEELIRAAVSRTLAEDPPYELQVHEGEDGEVLIRGGTDQVENWEFAVRSATGGRLLPDGKEAREVVVGVLDSVAEAVLETYNKADRATIEGRRALELLHASHYIPGNCGACPRYGRA